MQTIAGSLQMIHQLLCSINESRLHRAQFQELIAYLQAFFLRDILQSSAETERSAEAFHDEIMSLYLAFGVESPQFDIRLPVCFIEVIWVIEVVSEVEEVVQFGE